MKADKTNNQTEITGTVVRKKFSEGSKSEHDAIYIETETSSYVLRRVGANPFSDPELEKLVGKKICATGTINDYLFLASDIRET